MFVLRAVLLFAGLFVVGLGAAFIVTRERKYLTFAWRIIQGVLLLAVAFGLLYVFERVLLL